MREAGSGALLAPLTLPARFRVDHGRAMRAHQVFDRCMNPSGRKPHARMRTYPDANPRAVGLFPSW
jgi:hypothetical protein